MGRFDRTVQVETEILGSWLGLDERNQCLGQIGRNAQCGGGARISSTWVTQTSGDGVCVWGG